MVIYMRFLLDFIRLSYSSLYFRVILVTTGIFIGVFLTFKYHAGVPSARYPKDIEKRLEEIRSKVQRIAFSVPNSLFSEGREEFIKKIHEENLLLHKIRISVEELGSEIPASNKFTTYEKDPILEFYEFLETNIRTLDSTFAHITRSQEFDDISPYVQKLIEISKGFSNFSLFSKPNHETKSTTSTFSLKEQG